MLKSKDLISICRACKQVSSKFNYQVKDTELEGIEEVGLVCPNCDEWYHSYFANSELKEIADKVPSMARKQKREYQKRFDRLQKKIRRKLKMQRVGKRWVPLD